MSPVEIGLISIGAIIFMIYLGVYIPIALGVVSFVAIWIMRDSYELSFALLKIAIGDSAMEYTFATIPLFTFMGLIVSKAGLGADIYAVMNQGCRRITGGIGMATVGANAVFAAVTGSSIASASVFSKMSVPEMLKHDYNPRFAVGVVAGIVGLGHDHSSVGHVDHLFLCGRTICRRNVPRRRRARTDVGGCLRLGNLVHGAVHTGFRRRQQDRNRNPHALV